MKYLIATDGSPNALACVQFLSTSKLCEEDLVKVVTVWDASPYRVIPARLDKAKAESLLIDTVNTLKAVFGERVSGGCVQGEVVTSILRLVQVWQADKTLVGAHARTDLPEILIGDVAQEILCKSKTSVLIFRDRQNENVKSNHKKILCCVDNILLAEHHFAALPDAVELRVLHVLKPEKSNQGRQDPQHGPDFNKLVPDHSNIQQFMDEQIAKILKVRTDISTSSMIVEDINSVAGILKHSVSWQADLIITASHAYTHGQRILMGPISNEIAQRAKCSVEVVR